MLPHGIRSKSKVKSKIPHEYWINIKVLDFLKVTEVLTRKMCS